MRLIISALVVCCSVLMAGVGTAGEKAQYIYGHYSDQQLGAIKTITLPRTFLYDKNNVLIDPTNWPSDLSEVKKTMGDAFCCVTEDGSQSLDGKQPENCVKIIYGTDIASNFTGLMDEKGSPIRLAEVAKHKWLLVEYSASWCAPCSVEKKAIEHALHNSEHASDYVWLTVDMTRLIEAQAASKKGK